MTKLSSNNLITIIGGSGFVGRHLVRELAKTDVRLRIAVRHPNEATFLRPMGRVGQIQIVQANIRNEASLANAIAGAHSVINLVGTVTNKGHQTFHAVHEAGPETLARLCTQAGTKRLIHVSTIGADVGSVSKFARSKALGERAVSEACPEATIIRPSVIFGPEDAFFGRFAILAKLLIVMPLIGSGKTRFQPVYVDDVAQAICAAITNDDTAGRTYELGGPRIWTLREVYEFILQTTQRSRLIVSVPFSIAKMASLIVQYLPRHLLRPDQVNMLREDNVVGDDALTISDLGITPTPVEAIMPKFLIRYRKSGAYERDGAAS